MPSLVWFPSTNVHTSCPASINSLHILIPGVIVKHMRCPDWRTAAKKGCRNDTGSIMLGHMDSWASSALFQAPESWPSLLGATWVPLLPFSSLPYKISCSPLENTLRWSFALVIRDLGRWCRCWHCPAADCIQSQKSRWSKLQTVGAGPSETRVPMWSLWSDVAAEVFGGRKFIWINWKFMFVYHFSCVAYHKGALITWVVRRRSQWEMERQAKHCSAWELISESPWKTDDNIRFAGVSFNAVLVCQCCITGNVSTDISNNSEKLKRNRQ